MPKQYIPQTEWIKLSDREKNDLILFLGINKTIGRIKIFNNKIVEDGVTDDELKRTTNIGNLLMFLGEEDVKEFLKCPLKDLVDLLWSKILNKTDDKKVVTKEVNKLSSKKSFQYTNGRGHNKLR